jgi:anthranilate phosphoribosyltransferase
LDEEAISSAVGLLVRPDVPDAAKECFLDALHRRGETASELSGFVRILLARSISPSIDRDRAGTMVELCGTGGDRAGFLNVSTAAMFVVAGAGASVVKHGNRAVSSRSGSADVLEALGISIHVDPRRVGDVLEKAGCVFLLASDYHPAVAAVAPLRRKMASEGKMTIFNLIGPLMNPALPDVQISGIYRPELLSLYARALVQMGRRRAWAVHGEGLSAGVGVDELSITGPSRVVEAVADKATGEEQIREFLLDPLELGFAPVGDPRVLLGGDAVENAGRILEILEGREQGAARDMILLNAAAALHLADPSASLGDAVAKARESITSGAALGALNALRVQGGS